MGSTSDKASGLGNEAAGNVKQGVGKLVGNEQLQTEGKAQEIKGEAKSAIKDTADDVADAAHRKL